VLSRRSYDPLSGYSGAEAALYPALSDEATRLELYEQLSMEVPGQEPWPVRKEAVEVAWLLGAPFILQVIEAEGVEIAHIVGGMVDSSVDGQQLLDARWRTRVAERADTVVATVTGEPAHHDFTDLARALGCASRVVKPRGRIILLSRAAPELGTGADLLRQAGDPDQALRLLRQQPPPDMNAAYEWTRAVAEASVYLLSELPSELAEDLFVTPLEQVGQVQRLLEQNGSCLFLPDAHKMLAVPPDA
jgi:nickel-dependent lactate racemase